MNETSTHNVSMDFLDRVENASIYLMGLSETMKYLATAEMFREESAELFNLFSKTCEKIGKSIDLSHRGN